MQKRVEELGDKFKEVMGEPSTEPFAPENQRHSETWRTLVKPWWNLLAAQGGSAEGNSAPKPLLSLKTPKLVLLGKSV